MDTFVCDHFVNVVFVITHIWVNLSVVQRFLCKTDPSLCDFQGLTSVIADQIDKIVNLLRSVALCELLLLAGGSDFLLLLKKQIKFYFTIPKDR